MIQFPARWLCLLLGIIRILLSQSSFALNTNGSNTHRLAGPTGGCYQVANRNLLWPRQSGRYAPMKTRLGHNGGATPKPHQRAAPTLRRCTTVLRLLCVVRFGKVVPQKKHVLRSQHSDFAVLSGA